MSNPRVPLAGILAVLLSACSPAFVYEYTAPDSADGRACAAQCNNQRTSCVQAEQNAVAQCQSNRNG